MPSTPPNTVEEILATADIHPEFAKGLQATLLRPGSSYSISELKSLTESSLPAFQKALADSQPSELAETEHHIKLRDGHDSRIIVCHRQDPPSSAVCPLILLLPGGGHCIGYPEMELGLARQLALTHSAVVVCSSYRLAPEFPFPYSINDSWDTLQWAAAESRKSHSAILPVCTDARTGFIIGGSSAGANLAASLAHLARDRHLYPRVTGQFLSAGIYMFSAHVPEKYQPYYLSRTQNAHAPILDEELYSIFCTAFNPDPTSPLWVSFDQHHPDDAAGEVASGHMGLPPAYFQVCGMDMSRDDGLIYERVLREECRVSTRLDLYAGFGHCWWGLMPQLEMSRKRMKDSVDGVGWLLEVGKRSEQADDGR